VAILGLGRSALKPVAKENGLKTGMILPLCLSYDHRVIDGAQAVRFLLEVVHTLETFDAEGFPT
jgi:pyruvate dehydrogenase E2 component (dihydrolipoamide acetyltransferase)